MTNPSQTKTISGSPWQAQNEFKNSTFKPFNCKDNAVDWFQAQYNHGSRYDYLVLPLYAAPQQRTPLSDEVVAKLINDEWATPDVPSAWKFARAIERAHGITGEPT